MRRFQKSIGVLVLACVVCAVSNVSSAAIINVSGGDPGEGFSPYPLTFLAVDLLHVEFNQATQVVQGVPFTDPQGATSSGTFTSTDLSVNAGTPVGAGFSFATDTTTDDTNLTTVLQQALYGPPMTIVISGLAQGTNYKVDLFSQDGGNADRTNMTLTTTGATVATDTGIDALSGAQTATMTEEIMQPDVSGDITLVMTSSGSGTVVNALAVTYQVPEPASLSLLGVGGLLILKRRRTRAC